MGSRCNCCLVHGDSDLLQLVFGDLVVMGWDGPSLVQLVFGVLA